MGKKYQPSCKKELKELLEKDVRLGDIDTSLITDMTELFRDSMRKNFDGLETWDTSNVTGMSRMFCMAEYFNHPIECWDVSKVRDMSYMFSEAVRFNQPLQHWNVSNVQDMSHMFYGAERFNQPLDEWDTSKVEDMSGMFTKAVRFNQPLNSWRTGGVRDMSGMFRGASSFNRPLDMWQIPRFCNVNDMFDGAPLFKDLRTLALNFFLTNKKKYREYLKEVLGRFDAARVYAELSRYDCRHTAEYRRELETAHPELQGSVRAAAAAGY